MSGNVAFYTFVGGLLSLFVFVVWKSIYRLTLHPLAKFPGPRLGAISSLYVASCDLSSKDSFVKHLPELHDKYGPIVRVRPDEIHIRDFEAYSQVFKAGSKFARDMTFYNNPQIDGSILNIADAKAAKPHKDLFVPHFSKAAINRLEPLIHEKLSLFLTRMESAAFKKTPVEINLGYCCLTSDVVMYYCYQQTFGALDAPDFRFQIILDLEDFSTVVPLFWYFPTVGAIMFGIVNLLPKAVQRKYFPAAAAMNYIVDVSVTQIPLLDS